MIKALGMLFSVMYVLALQTPASAMSQSVVISHVQTGGSGPGTASQEFVVVANNALQATDVSGWCLKYADYTYTTVAELFCFSVSQGTDEVHMAPHAHVVIVSHTFPAAPETVTGVFKSSSTSLSGTRGHVVLTDSRGEVVDTVAWDNKASTPPAMPEVLAANAPAGGSMLARVMRDDIYVDTDNNSQDFEVRQSLLPQAAPLIDYIRPVEIVDICATIDGIQQTMPEGFDFDDAGNCERISLDVCGNLVRVQLEPPENLITYMGNCYDQTLDVCNNLDGFQLDVPSGYRVSGTGSCKTIQSSAAIHITEVMPNASGVDEGREFIELYNASQVSKDLSDYYLRIGKQLEKRIDLPSVVLAPDSYMTFSDTELGFTLLNTTTKVQLLFYDGTIVDEMISYDNPGDDIAWAFIDDVWQYTNNPTPGTTNRGYSDVLAQGVDAGGLAPCPAGKYRNPLTNRCRNVEEDMAVLASCDAGEYRNPETNRCRKIASTVSVFVPCEEGYERNQETNRCRKITQATTLAPCAEGSERNPETNRCRKVLSDQAGQATVENLVENPGVMNVYPFVLAAATGGVMYGIYEWRTEIGTLIRRVIGRFAKK